MDNSAYLNIQIGKIALEDIVSFEITFMALAKFILSFELQDLFHILQGVHMRCEGFFLAKLLINQKT